MSYFKEDFKTVLNEELVSYIIPILSKTILKDIEDSLNSLTFESNFIREIIIVFDGFDSFNLDFEIPNEFQKKIVFLYSYYNKGPGLSRNLGAIFSKSSILFFLDAGDKSSKNRVQIQLKELVKSDVSFGDIREINYLGSTRIRKGSINSKLAKLKIPFRTPFNNVTLAIKKDSFLNIGGYPNLRTAEDWLLMGKILKKNLIVSCSNVILVNVYIGKSFLNRRQGENIFKDIHFCLNELYRMQLFNKKFLYVSLLIQYLTRKIIPKKLLSFIYFLLRDY